MTAEGYASWLQDLADRPKFGRKDRRGTANYIDDAARARAAAAMQSGRCASLARRLELRDGYELAEGHLTVEVSHYERATNAEGIPYPGGTVDAGFDLLHVSAHGQRQTHLDGLNHCGLNGEWYSGFPVDDPEGPSVADLAGHPLFTRGVLADVPTARGTDWVSLDEPVTGEDIDACLRLHGVDLQPGDALLLYMGRDRFEAAGHRMDLMAGGPSPGAGAGAARWIAEHGVSMLCWDFLDAKHSAEPDRQVHSLVWAIGLLLVDNCDLRPAVELSRQTGSVVGGIIVSPPPLPRATGALVNPVFIQ